jgi:hypothetical protein
MLKGAKNRLAAVMACSHMLELFIFNLYCVYFIHLMLLFLLRPPTFLEYHMVFILSIHLSVNCFVENDYGC